MYLLKSCNFVITDKLSNYIYLYRCNELVSVSFEYIQELTFHFHAFDFFNSLLSYCITNMALHDKTNIHNI